MVRKGYIEQQIEEMGLLLARLIGLRKEGNYEAAMEELRAGAARLTGWDIDRVGALPESLLLSMLGGGNIRDTLEVGKCIALASLLCERAELYRLEGRDTDAVSVERKALTLFCEALIAEPYLRRPEYRERIDRITTSLSRERTGLGIPALHRLFHYRESVGEFARAEDILYTLRDDGTLPGLHAEAVAFYQRLLRLPDSELEAGDLPRNEVEEALAELKLSRD